MIFEHYDMISAMFCSMLAAVKIKINSHYTLLLHNFYKDTLQNTGTGNAGVELKLHVPVFN